MSQLSTLINKTVQEALTTRGQDGFDARALAPKVWQQLDDEHREVCGTAEIVRRLKSSAVAFTKDAFEAAGTAQIELPFKIDGAVSIDVDVRKIRLTESLSQMEFVRAMDIRRKQIRDDRKSLREWETAARLANPYWDSNPDWTFGQCVKALSRDVSRETKKSA